MSKAGLIVGLAVPLLLPAAAEAQGITTWFATEPVQVVAAPPAAFAADPTVQAFRILDAIMDRGFRDDGFARLIAQQNAIMGQLIAQMNAGMNVGFPAGGSGIRSQVVTISFDGSEPPKMTVHQSGSGCGALHQEEGTVPTAAPAPAEPAAPATSPRLIQVDHRQAPQPKPIYRG